ncbi:Predicted oxidoreductase [Haladaptatus litoreus]|uniref:Predicted oxidoreductase n=1 Tax=Haladaptatus litoreus TaxID=553468 RepID=A0A1N7E5C4_9EURY|nr:aldo/keto reductase [Haladaptatus litoreus]SIR83218.1 Predicted oxidoreductase [Haladaptatus litoreus]
MVLENESDTFDIGGERTVHRLGYGAMRLTGENIIGRPDNEEEARRVLHEAISLGVDFIDTADSYGPCVSERIIGDALHPYPDNLVVATKGGLLRNDEGDWLPNGDPDYLRNAILGSLDRLGTDSIDLYQLHRPDPDVEFSDSVHALAELKDEGKIEHVGLSNVDVDQLETARDIVEIATVQNQYNVGNREHEDVLSACENAGIGFIPWYPLGAGDLGDKADALREIANDHDASQRQVALAWLLHHSPVTLPIPGTSSVDHLHANIKSASIDLSSDEMERLD